MNTNCSALTWHDLQFALLRLPRTLTTLLKTAPWQDDVFVGGGYLRSIVAGEPVNDIDLFVTSPELAKRLANALVARVLFKKQWSECDKDQLKAVEKRIYKTDNALTLLPFTPKLQIIHRWTFAAGPSVADSFDFTNCAAVFWWGLVCPDGSRGEAPAWHSYCDPRFYPDIAAKRLIYRNPVREEEPGGSMLRVLKYYQKGYRIPLDCLADVITRLCGKLDMTKIMGSGGRIDQMQFSKVICGLLREVDPNIDPRHVAHLPAENAQDEEVPSDD